MFLKLQEMEDLELLMADMNGAAVLLFNMGEGPPPKMSDTWNRGAELFQGLHEAGHGSGPMPRRRDLDAWWAQAAFHAAGHHDKGTERWEPDFTVVGTTATEVLFTKKTEP